ncbi:MAG: tagH 1 [Acidobacteria bacterium]|nr:tagH 1 [Acidobacteriota bacterium]
MAIPPVVFDAVWKKFRQGERHDSLRDLIPAAIGALRGRSSSTELKSEEFWAVNDVSFEVQPGEALGIIGPNGAGKSTTLKLLTRILRPNRGRCAVTGRVGALIEVAAGFHPDLTGRENTYLQGSLMGMKRTEVAKKFDEIVEFAGVGAFVDTQVKRYSSGMNARLGFSIAAHLNPDVLIIDEVLSVGDMAFQEKCLQRMRGFKQEGVTIVFVSHNLQAVAELCDRALYLNRRARALGATAGVISEYVRDSFAASPEASQGEIRIASASLRQLDGTIVTDPVAPGTRLNFSVEFDAVEPVDDVTFAFRLHRATDQLLVYDGHFSHRELGMETVAPGRFTVQYQFDANLTRGQYYFDVFAQHTPTQRFMGRLRPAGHVTIAEARTWGGVADVAARASLVTARDPRHTGARAPEPVTLC